MLVYGECECFVMQMVYVCVFCGSSILVLLLFNIKLFSVFFYNSVPIRLLNFFNNNYSYETISLERTVLGSNLLIRMTI